MSEEYKELKDFLREIYEQDSPLTSKMMNEFNLIFWKAEQHKWLKKLAWFIMENMNFKRPFCDAFAYHFTSKEISGLDELTNKLFFRGSEG